MSSKLQKELEPRVQWMQRDLSFAGRRVHLIGFITCMKLDIFNRS